jgi:hypothetical protein
LKDTQLGTWFSQTHKKVAFVGGRMQVHALVTANGKSMKQLAASLTGPVTINIGTATVQSKKLSEAETLLIGLIARVAAAIFTGGASIIGTTIWDGAQAAPNPCQVAVAKAQATPAASRKKKQGDQRTGLEQWDGRPHP